MKKLYSVRTIILAGSLLLQLNTLCFHARGAAGDVDLSFDPGTGVNGTVLVRERCCRAKMNFGSTT